MPWKPEHRPHPGSDKLCTRCGLPSSGHRTRSPRVEYLREYNSARPKRSITDRIIGIDGEGIGRRPHNYIYLAAADEHGLRWEALGDPRILTIQALAFIASLPQRTLVVGFAFLYDLAKILQDMPDMALYLLFREEMRARLVDGKVRYRPITWQGFKVNFMNRRFSVQHGTRRTTVWDIFRFFQSKFTSALIDWQIADKARLESMERMKDRRANFDQLSRKDVYAYCQEECVYLAKLARQLLTAHTDAGIELKHYYGAGSTASALLNKWNVREYRAEPPEAMREPLACGFFGGRFENSLVGPCDKPVLDYDISSAYPYQATLLPCLHHGRWSHHGKRSVDRRMSSGRLALIRWHLPRRGGDGAWGPLPVRAPNGTIAFPLAAAGGWTWRDEFLAARVICPHLQALEVWIYETDCDCRPFGDLPNIYLERLKLGKDSLRGIPLKLGPNSVYGKVAQSKGVDPPFQSWVWAGNITSGTRAQLLTLLSRAKDPWNVLMLATDGLWTTETLDTPKPIDTGTGASGKPLGGWESEPFKQGVFAVRPGIYFPLNPTVDQLKKVRARGLGKRVLYEQHQRIIDAWEAGDDKIDVQSVERFVGAKSGISYGAESGVKRSADYGEWIAHDISVSFNPRPKREMRIAGNRLKAWEWFPWESVPYRNALISPEAAMLKLAEEIAEEQPNCDFGDVD